MPRKKTVYKLKKEGQLFAMVLATIIFAIVIVAMAVSARGTKAELAEYQKEELRYAEAISAEEQRSVEIENYQKYMQTMQYIEDMARAKGGLVYPDEYIFTAED